MSASKFETVIGLEVHCQLSTASKLFCSCKARLVAGQSVADELSNGNVCPICAGHPGTLPVLNKKALEYAVRAGLATGCTIRLKSEFSRKNYFYPDLPKGYQISQYDQPVCENGHLEVAGRKIPIQRIHMEEDAGKNLHMTGFSVVNLNRAGVPLIEIVSGPDLRTPQEAGEYLRKLYAIVTYLEICDGNLQEGNFRCDANVSIRPVGSTKFGTRVEIKNINSFRFVEKAIAYEVDRQIDCVESGVPIVQETRLYDAHKDATFSMRSKEEAHDYRYFPDPDLIPIQLDSKWISEIQKSLPELPTQKQARYIQDFELSIQDAEVLTMNKKTALFFEEVMGELQSDAKTTANLITGEVIRLINETSQEIDQSKLRAAHLAEIVRAVVKKEISSTSAKQLLSAIWMTGEKVGLLIERMGLRQVSDLSALEPVILKVLSENPEQVEQFKSGKEKVIGFLVGQVMKQSSGKANPQLVQDLLKKKIQGNGNENS